MAKERKKFRFSLRKKRREGEVAWKMRSLGD